MNSSTGTSTEIHVIDEYAVDGPATRVRLFSLSWRTTHVARESNWRSSVEGDPERWVRRAWNLSTLCGSYSATIVAGEYGDVATWPTTLEPLDPAGITCARCATRYPRMRGVA